MQEGSLTPEKISLPRLTIRPSTEEEEYGSLRSKIKRSDFYLERGLESRLPNHSLISQILNSPSGLASIDDDILHNAHRNEMYDPSTFEKFIRMAERCRAKLQSAFPIFQELNRKWGFRVYHEYVVRPTRYGVGGSYIGREDGSQAIAICLDSTPEQDLPRRAVHEFIHCGIETPIVKRFHLTHDEKERLVDLLIAERFGVFLTGKEPKSSPSHVDVFFDSDDLPTAIERYLELVPRELTL